jgi:hypothetical protein
VSSAGFAPDSETFADAARKALAGDSDAALSLCTDAGFKSLPDVVRFCRQHGHMTPTVFDLIADAWEAATALASLDSDCQGAA